MTFQPRRVRAVGVDAGITRAGTAKMTLYRNFTSKDDLILDFLRRREQLWTREWLEAESQRRGETPRDHLLAIFDVFSEWFNTPDFEGCSFLTTMVEINDRDHPVHQAAVVHLANIRSYIERLAAEAGIRDTDSFARKWHILMKGSIMAAHEGDTAAADRAGNSASSCSRNTAAERRRRQCPDLRISGPGAAARRWSVNAEFFGGQFRALHPVGDLLPGGLASEVR